ncbi:MAG: arginine--tRNA ligase [Burkholderiaceae bacterium]|nr:arginine--tRNA ligase [Burkholderiaceae bacterium]
MLAEHTSRLAALFGAAAERLAAEAGVQAALPAVELERPRQAGHGDLACNLAMQLARPLKANPRQIAERLKAAVEELDREAATGPLLDSLEVAGPGFINLRLRADAKRAVIGRVLRDGAAFGRGERGSGRRVMVEFVSANPTGPLHVGHGRQGALGDALAALLEADGWRVAREFYYNDAGAQIDKLALSVQARARGIAPDDERFPADGYRGDYIADIAADYLARKIVSAERVAEVAATGDVDDLQAIRRFAVAYLRHEQDIDLRAFGVRFDNYYLESSLYADGRVQATVDALVRAGKTYEDGGALWLRTTEFGDDKDRVMRKSDGGYTYFVPDVAYHVTKWQRGFERAINVQGSDHHGTVARVRAGLQAIAVGIPTGYPDYVLHKMVTVMRGGEEVKISKRAGSYVTLRDLINWTGEVRDGDEVRIDEQRGRDAVRFFLVSRKADSEFVFDVDLALARTDENPVYYIQYAHARICSVLAQWGGDAASLAASVAAGKVALDALQGAREFALAAQLASYPDTVQAAVDELAPHAIAFYLKDLAAELHSYYNAERVLVDDEATRTARLALLLATRQVLRNGLALIGVSAPERM